MESTEQSTAQTPGAGEMQKPTRLLRVWAGPFGTQGRCQAGLLCYLSLIGQSHHNTGRLWLTQEEVANVHAQRASCWLLASSC